VLCIGVLELAAGVGAFVENQVSRWAGVVVLLANAIAVVEARSLRAAAASRILLGSEQRREPPSRAVPIWTRAAGSVGLQAQLKTIQSSATKLVSSAKSDFPGCRA